LFSGQWTGRIEKEKMSLVHGPLMGWILASMVGQRIKKILDRAIFTPEASKARNHSGTTLSFIY